MNRALPTVLLAGLAVALSAGSVLAGRGGGGGFPRPVPAAPLGRRVFQRRQLAAATAAGSNRHEPALRGPHAVVQRAAHRFPAGLDAPALRRGPTRLTDRRSPTEPSPARPGSFGPALARPSEPALAPATLRPGRIGPATIGITAIGTAIGIILGTDGRTAGSARGLAGAWPRPLRGRGDTGSYYNPYCTAPVVMDGATIDYSQPIAAAVPPEPLADQTPPSDEASQLLDAARDAFLQGDYRAALSQVDRAIAQNPNDPLTHEFRCLACFALKQYKEAAAGAYAVLSAGPGWDWTTLSGFYPDIDIYTQQLRALEQYVERTSRPARCPVPLGLSLPDVRAHRCRGPATEGGRATEPERPVVGPTAGFAHRAAGSGTGRTQRARCAGQAGGRRQPGGRLERPGNRTARPSRSA